MSNYILKKDGLEKTIQAFSNRMAKLKHYYTNDVHLVIDKPLINAEENININPNSDKEVFDFVKKMEKKYSITSLNLVYRNLKQEQHNKTYLELLDLSTTNKCANQIFRGLSFTSKTILGNSTIGKGLNIGYINYLAKDLFDCVDIDPTNYALKECMDIIVKVVGKEKMDNFFLTNNLKDLRSTLARYTSYPATDSFILDMDYFLTKKNKYRNLINYLDRLYKNKLDSDLSYNLIDLDYVDMELDYLQQHLSKIENIITLGSDEYYDYIKQFEPKEIANIEASKEYKKNNKKNILNIW